MAVEDISDKEAKALLANCLSDPLGLDSPNHVRDWFEFLKDRFPLWAFQPWAYGQLLGMELPTAYPLQLFIDSILDDEGLLIAKPESSDWLSHVLDLRRDRLSTPNDFMPVFDRDQSPGPWQAHFGGTSARDLAIQWYAAMEYHPKNRSFYQSLFEEIGRELVKRVEDWIVTPDKTDASKKLDELWHELAAELGVEIGSHRLPEGPQADILEPIVTQGRQLLTLCWNELPPGISAKTNRAFSDSGVAQLGEQKLWAARLTLPILSEPEIRTLIDQADSARDWRLKDSPPTSLKVVIWILAHRLQVDAKSIARKVSEGGLSEYFYVKHNPIDSYPLNAPRRGCQPRDAPLEAKNSSGKRR